MIALSPNKALKDPMFHQFSTVVPWFPGSIAEIIPLGLMHDLISDSQSNLEGLPNYHHDFVGLFMVNSGRGTHIIDDIAYSLCPGDVYLTFIGSTHLYIDCADLDVNALFFRPDIFDDQTMEQLGEVINRRNGWGGQRLRLSPAVYSKVARDYQDLEEEWRQIRPGGALVTKALLIRLLAHISRAYAETELSGFISADKSSVHLDTISAAVAYMNKHHDEPLRVSDIAASVFLSSDYFSELFLRQVGKTPREYLKQIRVDHSKRLLAETNLSITSIAQNSGFGESSYFTRIFRSVTSTTPSAYRRSNRRGCTSGVSSFGEAAVD